MSHPEVLPAAKPADVPDAIASWVNGHPDDGLLHAGLDDQLPTAESALVAEHVSRCASCRARVAEAHGLIAASRRIVTRAKEVSETAAQAPVEPPAPAAARVPSAPRSVDVQSSQSAPATAPIAAPAVAAVIPKAAAVAAPAAVAATAPPATTAPATPAVAPKPAAARPAPKPPASSTPTRKQSTFPWARVGSVVALTVVILSGVLVWRTLGRDMGTASPAPVAVRPVVQPDTLGVADEASREAPAAVAAASPAPDTTVTQVASANGKLDTQIAPSIAAFDSLVLTRRACAASCDEFTLYVMSNGSVHYVRHSPNGQEHSTDATTADPALRRMSALITTVLFETSAVPSSGRSVCTVFDAKHVPSLQLMVAHGSSRALHANSCSAPPKALLALGAQIDSLAGSERLQRSLAAERK